MAITIPFMNLARQNARIRTEIDAAIASVIDTQAFIQGPYVREFEAAFARHSRIENCVACSNGTTALSIALEMAGVSRGDEVITVANTFFATAEAICHVGAKPIFVDVDPVTYTMDPAAVAAAIGPRTKAILPVHIYGMPCDMAALCEITEKHELRLIEDCAQAHMASFQGRPVGSFGDAGAFSFYPGKNLGAFGDAGCIVTRDRQSATVAAKLVDHGRLTKYEHETVGYNQRMDGIQAAVLLVKLKYLSEWTKARQNIAEHYRARLSGNGFQLTPARTDRSAVYHLLVVQVSNRMEVAEHLRTNGIATGIHYPVPLHLQPALNYLGYAAGGLPVTEALAERVLSLPICGEISISEVDYVCDKFLEVAQP